MTGFTGRGASGMYASIANLNTVPSDYELAMQQQQEGYNMQADLDLFTNAQFFDFDMAEMPGQSPGFNDNDSILNAKNHSAQQPLNYINGEFQVSNYNNVLPQHAQATQIPHHVQSLPPQYPSNVSSPSSSASMSTPSEKRKFDTTPLDPTNPMFQEEASRAAAEEDKRRRNTAASARFRVKKKQREAALERAAKDMTDKMSYLEGRVAQLEMENKLLKDLITEKGSDLSDLTRKSKGETKSHDVKGVGTAVVEAETKVEA